MNKENMERKKSELGEYRNWEYLKNRDKKKEGEMGNKEYLRITGKREIE